MFKKVVLVVFVLVILNSFAYAIEVQTEDIENYIQAYEEDLNSVEEAAYTNMYDTAYDVFSSYEGFTFYDVGEIIDTKGNRQKLYELWRDDEIFVSSQGIVVNDHKANEVVYTLMQGNLGIQREDEGTQLSGQGVSKVDKVINNIVFFEDNYVLSGSGSDFFDPQNNNLKTNSKFTYNMDNRIGVIPNYGKDVKDYFSLYEFSPTGFATAFNYDLSFVDIYYDNNRPMSFLGFNGVAVESLEGGNFFVKASCCSYLYLTDALEEKAFPLIARRKLKGDTAIVLDKDVRVFNSYKLTDGVYSYEVKGVSSPMQGTEVLSSDGKVIQASYGLPYQPRNSKERRLLEA